MVETEKLRQRKSIIRRRSEERFSLYGSKPASAWQPKYVPEITVDEENSERSSGCVQDMVAREDGKEMEKEKRKKGRKGKEWEKNKKT